MQQRKKQSPEVVPRRTLTILQEKNSTVDIHVKPLNPNSHDEIWRLQVSIEESRNIKDTGKITFEVGGKKTTVECRFKMQQQKDRRGLDIGVTICKISREEFCNFIAEDQQADDSLLRVSTGCDRARKLCALGPE